jgi:hypothetical protein
MWLRYYDGKEYPLTWKPIVGIIILLLVLFYSYEPIL